MLTIVGAVHQSDAVAQQAETDARTALTALNSLSPTSTLTGHDLGSVGILTPGVYSFAASAQLTGGLVLNFGGLSNQSIVFQIGSTLTTASGSSVTVIGGGANDLVYFDVGSSATLGTGTAFIGTILAQQSVTLATGVSISCGRAIALTGAVTLDTDTADITCLNGGPSATPEPSALLLFGSGLIGLAVSRRAKWSHRQSYARA